MSTDIPVQPSGVMSRHQLRVLAEHRGGPHVSIYLPTERAGPQTRENPIRLKNLLRSAEEQLIAAHMRPTEARDLLDRAGALEQDYDFWQHQSEGLCIHIVPGFFAQYSLPMRVHELCVVAERFHVRPLLDLFTSDAYFYLLALSIGDVRVFRCGRYSEQELSVMDMPRNMEDALWPEDPEKQRQFRAMHSGQAGEEGILYSPEFALQEKEELLAYFRQVDQSLHHLLRTEKAPLVVVAVDYLHPIYVEANTYRHLLPEGVMGNPEDVQPDELRFKAWQLVEPEMQRARTLAQERFEMLHGTGRASAQIGEIVREASRGRIDTLLIAREGVVWGKVAEDGEAIEVHDRHQTGDQDLLDLAAVQTITQGGDLYTLDRTELPAGALGAAIYRY